MALEGVNPATRKKSQSVSLVLSDRNGHIHECCNKVRYSLWVAMRCRRRQVVVEDHRSYQGGH
jgi:hypothetical protein